MTALPGDHYGGLRMPTIPPADFDTWLGTFSRRVWYHRPEVSIQVRQMLYESSLLGYDVSVDNRKDGGSRRVHAIMVADTDRSPVDDAEYVVRILDASETCDNFDELRVRMGWLPEAGLREERLDPLDDKN